jgi:thiosulfate reductase cytochrome b subunit
MATGLAAAPAVGAAILGFRVMGSPLTAVGLAAAWLLLSLMLHWGLTKLAVTAFERRREALVATANGR